MSKRNTSWVLTVTSPLLRPGLTLTMGPVSERYVVEEVQKAMDMVREINTPTPMLEDEPAGYYPGDPRMVDGTLTF